MIHNKKNSILEKNSNCCIFTICTKSYIGLAEVLGESLRDYGVKEDFVIVVVDHDVYQIKSSFGILVHARDFCGFEHNDWTTQTFKYNLVEFCTSIKARCFSSLFAEGYDKVVYFDPDILVFDDLTHILDKLDTHDVVVTPHRLDCNHDVPSRGGLFNLGFLAVRRSPRALQMLTWWDERLIDYSFNDASRGYFTDQKWMDNLPLLVDTHLLAVLDHPGMNLAPWNLHEREVTIVDDKIFVSLRSRPDDWRPVSFIHFSGFNYLELASGIFGKKTLDVCSRMKGFDQLVIILSERLKNSRYAEFADIPYEFSCYSNGCQIHPGHRRIFARLYNEDNTIGDPFAISGVFYQEIRRGGMLVKKAAVKGASVIEASQVNRVSKLLDILSRLVIRLVGYDRFFMLCKFLTRYLHTVNHARLIGGKSSLEVEYF